MAQHRKPAHPVLRAALAGAAVVPLALAVSSGTASADEGQQPRCHDTVVCAPVDADVPVWAPIDVHNINLLGAAHLHH